MSFCRRFGTSLLIRHFAVSLFLGCALIAGAFAQKNSSARGLNDPERLDISAGYETAPGTAVLVFHVYSERKGSHLDRQALLKLENANNHAAAWQTTENNTTGVFTNVGFGNYQVEVSAVGYLSTQKDLRVMDTGHPTDIEIVLQRDPEAINLEVEAAVLSPKARKETKKAVSALKSNNFKEAQKQLDEAYKSSPSSADVNFLLGYLYFQKNDFAQAENYLTAATNFSPHNAQALTLLGRTGLERQDYPKARSALEQAVLADAENWLPHNLLADTYLHQQDFDKARDQAQIAITKGKTVASPARIVLGQALVSLGRDQEAVETLNDFLKESPKHPMAGQVRSFITEIEQHEKVQNQRQQEQLQEQASAVSSASLSTAEIGDSGIDPLAAMPTAGLSMKPWKPPGIDDVKLTLAAGVQCPAAQVMEESGRRMKEFIDDVARFAAVEELFHQSLDQFGIPLRTETRKYNYVASISQPQPGFLAVDEYRADKLSLSGYPDQIASVGFAALALVFHPDMRDNFAMTCEGLGDWRGQATWLVHFRQRDDRPNRMHSYNFQNRAYPVGLKGRAWITAETFQIVRIEAEMISPMPEIQLLSEHQAVDYGPVPFPKKNTTLWLPKSAEIYFDFRKHRYYRRHSFDHYMLYSVDSEEKRKEPVAKPAEGEEPIESKKPS